jgi:hypothetical protein
MHRRVEAFRDSLFFRLGTSEALIEDDDPRLTITRQWRRPLSLEEVNQMANTPEVRARAGRP